MNKQSGNILFIILIAVALFAALSYAVSSMMQPNSKDSSEEKVRTLRGQINDMEASINASIRRMMISNGCQLRNATGPDGVAENTMNPASAGYGALTRHDCNVFDTRGGGVLLTWDSANANNIIMGGNKINFGGGALTNTRNVGTSYIFVMELAFSTTSGRDYALFQTICTENNTDVSLPAPATLTGAEATFAQVILSGQAGCYIDGSSVIHYIFPVGPNFLGP